MKYVHTLALALFVSTIIMAQDPASPIDLSQKEIADGWIQLFDGTTTFGWAIEGEARIEKGVLVLGGKEAATATTTSQFPNCELEFEFSMRPYKKAKLKLGEEEEVLAGALVYTHCRAKLQNNKIHSFTSTIPGGGGTNARGRFGELGVSQSRSSVSFQIPMGHTLSIRNIKLKPIGLQPFFNGKDLSGWEDLKDPGRNPKSTYEVKDGVLTIKDGPGDLQTTGQWADFVLQTDIRSNGRYLNSGIFFRTLPGKFWSGYESQIRNQWAGGDRNRPVDFGTGGIYRRQEARRVVSTDNEWFTKTIIAHGNHFAIWVNGYQVADFTDERPPSDNGRNGLKLDKGPISLQGHDPRTDLSFRNMRIVELR